MEPQRKSDPFEALGELLESAVDLVGEMTNDPLLGRLLGAYARMPREDRPVLVDVFVREVGLRLTTLNGGDAITGVGARPNPNARLYLRTFEKLEEKVPTLGHDELVYSSVRSARIMRLALTPGVHDAWHAATTQAFGLLDPDDRRAVRTILGELFEILDRVEHDHGGDPADGD